MTALPSGTTHSRYNKQKGRTNYFNIEGEVVTIWNNAWEPYSGNMANIKSITEEAKVVPVPKNLIPKNLPSQNKPSKNTTKTRTPIVKAEVKYDPVFPTFAEEVMDRIPSVVLRQLLQHYKNADVIEVEINVKTTHTIKG